MKIFKIEAEGDLVYVQGVDEDAARTALKELMGDIPEELLTINEVAALPEGEEVLNPLD